MHLCWAFSFLEQFPRIQDTFRIPSFFQGLHQFQGHGVCVFGEEGFAGLADTVFAGDGAAHFVDSRAGLVFESCEFCLFIGFVGKAPAQDVEVDIAVAGVADAAEDDAHLRTR